MPFLRSSSTDTNLLTPNPFLVFRLVLLALLSNIALLSLIFASWNINASFSAGLLAPATSIFIIFESCLFFICVIFAFAEFFRLNRKFSYTVIECCWIGFTSLFQTGAAISSTINGPTTSCHSSADWGVCASSLLLVPSTWLSSILCLTYFLALFATIIAHKSIYPDIWKRTVYTIEWFGRTKEHPSHEKIIQNFLGESPLSEEDPYRDYYEDIESTTGRKKHYPIHDSINQATSWGPLTVRRGIDHPFTRPISNRSSSTPQRLNLELPSLPRRSADTGAGSRHLEKFRESGLLSRSESPMQYTRHYFAHNSSFPPSVADLDKPIPLPELSEWVRADPAL